MKHVFCLTVVGALTLAMQTEGMAAQTDAPAPISSPLQLSEQDRAIVVGAALEARSHQTTPKGFTPALGVTVPQTVFIHGFNPEITRKVPILKHYWYAYLNREILLIDGTQKKVVAIIPLPEKFVSEGQPHQGAAEPESQRKKEDGAKSSGSVPAYTSPETLR